ncbi:MAG: hypothetical protein ABI461_09140 [Polyangiaceae bacterium]
MTTPRDDIEIDPDAPPSEEELAAAEQLRLALEDPSRASNEAELARALSLAHTPREIPADVNAALVAKSLEKMAVKRASDPQRGRVIRVAFGAVAATLAIAAAAILFVQFNAGNAPQVAVLTPAVPLVQVRSTAPLFHEPFPASDLGRVATASTRIDRIAMARGDDLRENMYASWGVK